MSDNAFDPADVNFEQVYRGETELGGGPTLPWDIGRPQPALVAAVEAGGVQGDVLDVGSGLGDNSIFLASRGYKVTGVDGSPTALEKARERARRAGVDVDFQEGDATRLEGLDGRFDTVVDSALYHCLSPEQRFEYVAAIHRATRPGARLHIFCFSDRIPAELPGPYRISQENLRETVGPRWTIESIEADRYDSSSTIDDFVRQARRFGQEVAVPPEAAAAIELDDEGHARMPIWHLTATRA